MDILEPQFTQPEVLAVTSCRAKNIHVWIERGIYSLQGPPPGTGRRRKYSALDCVRLALMCELTAFGIPALTAKGIAFNVASPLEDGKSIREDKLLVITRQVDGFFELSGVGYFNTEAGNLHYEIDKFGLDTILATLMDRRKPKISLIDQIKCNEHDESIKYCKGHRSVFVVCAGEIVSDVLDQLQRFLNEDA